MALILKNLLFTVVIPGTVAAYVPLMLVDGLTPPMGSNIALAVMAFGLGSAIYAWCVWDFAAFGRGTPAPIDAPKKLVARGLYRFVRNPMYLGVLIVVLGWVALYQTLGLVIYIASVASCFHLFIVLYEEPHLRRQFGEDYAEYCGRVPRWLPWPD